MTVEQSKKHKYRTELEVFGRLRHDLKAIAAGSGPTAAELAAAPIIESYDVTTRSLPCLAGQLDGQPLDSSDVTGALLLMLYAPTLGWARTRSGYFRLGLAADRK